MKINLETNEEEALANMVASNANHVPVLKKILKNAIAELKDVTKIDSKGNMGLQALSRQLAVEQLEEIDNLIFGQPGIRQANPADSEKPSKWR